jgi:excisionase family DNA binding protein
MNMAQWSDLPLVLTSDQVAAVLQLTRRTITTMLDRGDLRGIKVGKEWRVSRAELMQFVGEYKGLTLQSAAASTSRAELMQFAEDSSGTPAGVRTQSTAGTAPELVSKGGVLVVRAEPTEDLADFARRERGRRVTDLIRQAGL